jgi:hypothetical protein
MEFVVEWDQRHEVALIKHTRLVLDSREVVRAWREHLFSELDAIRGLRGKKFPIVVCIDNFMIRPKVADDYGRAVREMIQRYATAVARYGEPSTVKQIIAVEAMKEGFRANLFETFEQAVAFFEEPSSAPPTSRALRGLVSDASSAPPASRSPRALANEALARKSLAPRPVVRAKTSLPVKPGASEEQPSGPTSRRPERIIVR